MTIAASPPQAQSTAHQSIQTPSRMESVREGVLLYKQTRKESFKGSRGGNFFPRGGEEMKGTSVGRMLKHFVRVIRNPRKMEIGKIVCSLSKLHKWGDWEYVSPDSCQQVIICRRCKIRLEAAVPHSPGKWKSLSSPCYVETVCLRCKHNLSQWNHSWTTRYGKRVCGRCGFPGVPFLQEL